ncbi:MAG: protease pro-enzyme activation domain-containing protein [Saccharolobus sp.]
MNSKIIKLLLPTLFILSIAFPLTSLAFNTDYIQPNYSQYSIISKLNGNTPIYLEIFIPPKNLNSLYLIAQEVANHQIKPLSNKELISMFSQQDKVNEVVNYLTSNGFNIVYKGPFEVIAEAPASLVSSVFNTKLVLVNSSNEIYYKPQGNVNIPTALNNVLIGGLTNYTNIQIPLVKLGNLNNGNLILSNQTHSSFAYTFQFSATWYTPQDIQGAYNVTPILNSTADKRITIAIVDAYGDPEIYQDVKLFDSQFHLPPINLTILPIGPYNPINGLITGWYEEVALDVEAAHSVAPYANILLVIAPSATTSGLFSGINLIVSEDLAQVVSMSWGLPSILFGASGFYAVYQGVESPNYPSLDYYFELGTAEGISFFAASGDQGAYNNLPTTYDTASYPASSPFVTAVGGTTLYLNFTSGYISAYNTTATYGYETAWSVNPLYFGEVEGTVSSGGGYNTLFPAPWYQRYVTHSNYRTIPDVAADANPYTGFVIYALGQQIVIGGTSLATPIWAGIIADIDAYIGHPLGLVNPLLYEIYQNSTLYHEAFHQITLGYNGLYYANSSYNLVTGLGSPNAGELANVIKHIVTKSLSVSVSTFEPGVPQPWYFYNTTFNIVAYITYPNNTEVKSGDFNAYIYTPNGYLANISLHYNGSYWVGNFTIRPSYPPNLWEIVVNGTSGKFSGIGTTEIDVGESINIISPIPYPFSSPLPYNELFTIQACVYYPNGSPVVNQSVNGYLVKNGQLLAKIPLVMISPGMYQGAYALLPPLPQGTYILVVNDSYGSAYSYVYFGEYNFGAILTPVNDGFPAAAPGQNITIIDEVLTPQFTGLFTSNVTAFIYNSSGALIGKIKLIPAPDVVQFGIYLLFFLYEGNFTIPNNLAPGFYNVVINSVTNTSVGLLSSNFTTAFYVSPANLNYNVKVNTMAYEGEWLRIIANITYPNGTEVKYGMFTATVLPTELNYESLIIGSEVGVPLQYNSTLKEWIGVYQIPSIFEGSIYQGSPIYSISGPWNVIISGVSSEGYNLYSTSYSYFNVLPYTFMNNIEVNGSNTNLPLLSKVNSTTYMISFVKINNITVTNNTNLILDNVIANTLVVKDSKVIISSSTVNQIIAENSTINIIESKIGGKEIAIIANNSKINITSSIIQDSTYAFSQANSVIMLNGVNMQNVTSISTIPKPTLEYSPTNITIGKELIMVNISGEYLKLLGISVNGQPISYHIISSSPTSILVSIPFNSSLLADGNYLFTVTVSDGLPYNLTFNVINSYHLVSLQKSITSLRSLIIPAIILAIISIIISIIAILFIFMRRGGGK